MPFFSAQDGPGGLRVLLWCTAFKVLPAAAFKAKIFRTDRGGPEPSVPDLTDSGGRAHGYLIQLVHAVYDHASFYTQTDQDLGQGLHQIVIIDAQQLHGRRSRIGQGTENIKYRTETQFPADGTDIFHGSMVFLGKEETHACLFQHFHTFGRALMDIDAQSLQTVRSTAHGRSSPVSVLGHLHAARGRYQGGSSGNIKTVGVVTAGPYDLKYIHAGIDPGGVIAHGRRAARDLILCLSSGALGRQGRQKRGILGRCRLSAHDLIHDIIRFLIGQIFLAYDFDDCFFDHTLLLRSFGQTARHPWCQSPLRSFACLVSITSGGVGHHGVNHL